MNKVRLAMIIGFSLIIIALALIIVFVVTENRIYALLSGIIGIIAGVGIITTVCFLKTNKDKK